MLGDGILAQLGAILGPFAIWGSRFDTALSLHGARDWMQSWGAWSWAAGIALIVADIVLPVPATVVMSAIGLAHGWLVGGVSWSVGSLLAGIIAYAACRWPGDGAARSQDGEERLRKAEWLVSRHGLGMLAR